MLIRELPLPEPLKYTKVRNYVREYKYKTKIQCNTLTCLAEKVD